MIIDHIAKDFLGAMLRANLTGREAFTDIYAGHFIMSIRSTTTPLDSILMANAISLPNSGVMLDNSGRNSAEEAI